MWASKRPQAYAKESEAVDETALVDTRRFQPQDAKPETSALPWGAFFVLFMLALDAGVINVICRAGTWSHFTSHVSGNTSRAGMYYSGADTSHIESIEYSGRQVFAFGFGAALSGIIISKRRVEVGKALYGLALMLASAFLLGSWYMVKKENGRMLAVLSASIACGLQNGMGLTFCGAVVRTTHMTGVATDIGNVCGRNLGRRAAGIVISDAEADGERRSLILLCVLMVGYIFGGMLGAVMIDEFGDDAMLGPALLSFFMGLSYTLYRICFLKQAVLSTQQIERSPSTEVKRFDSDAAADAS